MAGSAERLALVLVLAVVGLGVVLLLLPQRSAAETPTPTPTLLWITETPFHEPIPTPYAGPPGWFCGTPAPPPPTSDSRWYYGLPLCTPTPRATAVHTPYPTIPRATIPRATISVSRTPAPTHTLTPTYTPTPTSTPTPTGAFYIYSVFYPPVGVVYQPPVTIAGYGDGVSVSLVISAFHHDSSQLLYGFVFSPTSFFLQPPVTITICSKVREWRAPCCETDCNGCVSRCGYAMWAQGGYYHLGIWDYKWDYWGSAFWDVPLGDCRLSPPGLREFAECFSTVESPYPGQRFGYGVFYEGWGIQYVDHLRISILVGPNIITYTPPISPTPTPTPTPACVPCRNMVVPDTPPIWLEPPEIGEPRCYEIFPHIGWSNAPFGIPDFEFGPVQLCVRYVTLQGEIFGIDLNALVTAIASLVAIAILASILAGV
jgi:hypothetical protein